MFNKTNYIFGFILLIAVLLTSCKSGKKEDISIIQGNVEQLVNWTDEYVESRVKKDKLDGGLSVMIYSGTEVIYNNGAGWADKSKEIELNSGTPMPVGSISKIFTSVAIMKLVENGKLELDSAVGSYLPMLELADGEEMNITVRDLLTHHSGIQGDLFENWFNGDKEELYGLLKDRPLASNTEKFHSYANIGFSLLGLIIEEISGETYSDFVRDNIFIPSGMKNSLVYPGEIEKELPRGYRDGSDISVPVIRDIPAGGLLISSEDMGLFIKSLYGDESVILKKETLKKMLTVQNRDNLIDRKFEIGLGFWLIDPINSGELMASHGGDLPPYHSILITMPNSDLAVFVATNDHNKDGFLAIESALDIIKQVMVFNGKERPEPKDRGEFLTVDEQTQKTFSGTYNTLGGVITVEPKGDAFMLTLAGKKLYFAPKDNGLYGVQFKLFNKITIPVPQLEMMEFDMFEAEGNVWMSLWMGGIYMGAFSKLSETEYPESFEKIVGEYIINSDNNILEDGSRAIDDVGISYKNNLYILEITMLGQKLNMALRSDGDSRAFTDGKGRAMGDLLVFNNDDESLNWSGFTLTKKK